MQTTITAQNVHQIASFINENLSCTVNGDKTFTYTENPAQVCKNGTLAVYLKARTNSRGTTRYFKPGTAINVTI